jgi:hypothetical protein
MFLDYSDEAKVFVRSHIGENATGNELEAFEDVAERE